MFSRWSGKWSFRVNIGSLWFGVNFQNPAGFIIWNGGKTSWQIASWNPHFTKWNN